MAWPPNGLSLRCPLYACSVLEKRASQPDAATSAIKATVALVAVVKAHLTGWSLSTEVEFSFSCRQKRRIQRQRGTNRAGTETQSSASPLAWKDVWMPQLC